VLHSIANLSGFCCWFAGEEGQDLVEYALLVGLVALICIVAVLLAGQETSMMWAGVTVRLQALAGGFGS
jgi:Flp pilus assembly pilin Flp